MSWTLDVEVVDKNASGQLAKLAKAQEKTARSAVEAAQKVEQAAIDEADAVKRAASDQEAARRRAAVEAQKAADRAVKAAERAAREGSKEADRQARDAKRVAAAKAQALRVADRETSRLVQMEARKSRAAQQASRGVTQASREHERAMQRVGTASERSARQVQRSSAVADQFRRTSRGLASDLGGLARRIGRLSLAVTGLGGAFSAVGAVGLAKKGIQLNAEFQSLTSQYTTLLGSEKRAEGFIEQMRGVSRGSAFRLTEVLDASRGLIGGEMPEKEAVKAMTAVRNAALVAGGDASEKLGRISEVLGVIQARGKVGAEDLNRLAEAGVHVRTKLAEPLGLTADQMGEIGKQGVTAEKFIKAFSETMTSGDMAKAAENMSKDFKVQMLDVAKDTEQVLRLALERPFGWLNKTVMPAVQKTLGEAITAMERTDLPMRARLELVWDAVQENLGPIVDQVRGEFEKLKLGDKIADGIEKAVPKAIDALATGLANGAPKAAGAFIRAFTSMGPWGQLLTTAFLWRKLRLPVGGAGRLLGRALGLPMGTTAVDHAKGQLARNGAITGSLGARMKSIGTRLGGWLGLPIGTTAADKAASGIGKSGAITGKVGGRMAPIGRGLGVLMGAALAAAAINELTRVFTGSSITERLRQGMGLESAPGSQSFSDALPKKTVKNPSLYQRQLDAIARGKPVPTKRSGGTIRAFAAGGLATAALMGAPAFAHGGVVPAMVSPGEVLRFPDGGWGVVPGARVAADNVFAALPVNTEVYTDHGQSLLAAGFSRSEALDAQLPHFNTGGKATKKRPVRSARVGYTVFDDPPPGAFGSLTNGYAELGTARRTDGKGTGFGWIARALGLKGELPANTPLAITINGKTHTLRKRDRGYGQGGDGRTSDPKWALDVWKDSWAKFGINAASKGMATVALGTAADVKRLGTTGRDYSYTVARRYGKSTNRAGLLDDAYSLGFSGVETWGSRAAARRAGASLGVSAIREALDAQQDSYTRTINVSAPSSRSAAAASSVRGAVPAGRGGSGKSALATAMAQARKMGLTITSTTGGKHTANSWHYKGRAFDSAGSPGAMMNFARWARRTYPRALELFHDPLGGWKNGQSIGPIGGHGSHVHLALRRGGRVAGFRRGGRISRSLGQVRRSTSAGNLSAFGAALEQATLERVRKLHDSLLREIRKRGDRRVVDRLRSALSLIEVDLGGRLQERLSRSAELAAGWERKTGESSHWMRRAGVDEGSPTGIKVGLTNAQTYLRSQSGSELSAANAVIREARALLKRATSDAGREAARAKLTEALSAKQSVLDARTEARSLMAELTRALPRALADQRASGLELMGLQMQAGGWDTSRDLGLLLLSQQEWQRQYAEATAAKDQAWQQSALSQLVGTNQALRELPASIAAREEVGFDFRAALAALTESTADDMALLHEREQRVQGRLDQALHAVESATTAADREAAERYATEQATLLRGIRDELKSANTAQQERDARDEEIRELLRTIAESSQRQARGTEVMTGVIDRWRSDGATGQVARNVGMRGATPGYAGGGVRG